MSDKEQRGKPGSVRINLLGIEVYIEDPTHVPSPGLTVEQQAYYDALFLPKAHSPGGESNGQ